jgi:hypothetical protein
MPASQAVLQAQRPSLGVQHSTSLTVTHYDLDRHWDLHGSRHLFDSLQMGTHTQTRVIIDYGGTVLSTPSTTAEYQ